VRLEWFIVWQTKHGSPNCQKGTIKQSQAHLCNSESSSFFRLYLLTAHFANISPTKPPEFKPAHATFGFLLYYAIVTKPAGSQNLYESFNLEDSSTNYEPMQYFRLKRQSESCIQSQQDTAQNVNKRSSKNSAQLHVGHVDRRLLSVRGQQQHCLAISHWKQNGVV